MKSDVLSISHIDIFFEFMLRNFIEEVKFELLFKKVLYICLFLYIFTISLYNEKIDNKRRKHMSNHYYSKSPVVESQLKKWNYRLKDYDFTFFSDNGVFSKHSVDFGSSLLIHSLSLPTHLENSQLLDMGCGYGPIGLSFARAYPQLSVEMVDINERAVELALKNATLNRLTHCDIHESNLFESVHHDTYGVILSNPPIRAGKKVIHHILSTAYERLISRGILVIVIQKKQGAESAEKKMMELFGNCTRIAKSKGYWILLSERLVNDGK